MWEVGEEISLYLASIIEVEKRVTIDGGCQRVQKGRSKQFHGKCLALSASVTFHKTGRLWVDILDLPLQTLRTG